jgi:hypothetical protein
MIKCINIYNINGSRSKQGCCLLRKDDKPISLDFQIVENSGQNHSNANIPIYIDKYQPSELSQINTPENKSVHKLSEELDKLPTLRLAVLESTILKVGREYIITCHGLVGSKNKNNDGIAYIGSDNKNVYFIC